MGQGGENIAGFDARVGGRKKMIRTRRRTLRGGTKMEVLAPYVPDW